MRPAQARTATREVFIALSGCCFSCRCRFSTGGAGRKRRARVPRLSAQSGRSSQNSFTRAKKPEDSGEVSRPSPAATNSRSSCPCFLVRLTGVSRATSTYISLSALERRTVTIDRQSRRERVSQDELLQWGDL